MNQSTFAYWTSLLASLGRMDTLKDLFQQTQGRVFDGGPLQQVVNATKEGYHTMLSQPGICFKCGTFALNNVGQALKGRAFDFQRIDSVPSPRTGFTMTTLAALADQAGLDLVPVEWAEEKTLVVPSIIHWRQNHYAAILEERSGQYRVVDPTFGRPRWLKGADIREEASGYFMVPKAKAPQNCRLLAASETDRISGQGFSYGIGDGDDGCGNGSGGSSPPGTSSGSSGASGGTGGGSDTGTCTGTCGSTRMDGGGGSNFVAGDSPGGTGGGSGSGGSGSSCCGGGGSGGSGSQGGNAGPMPGTYVPDNVGGGGSGGPLIIGMPTWEVSEPYITTWLYDIPLTYRSGLGYPIVFRLAYKQRETKVNSPFSVGQMWNCSWLSYVSFLFCPLLARICLYL